MAQGCPLSPLLFLVIAEPLTRLINNHPNINGVTLGGRSHRISQYADDSTLIARPRDIPYMNTCLRIWFGATAMRENKNKREALLLGSLRRHPERAPLGVVKDDAYTPDGRTIRALGVPIGNAFNLSEWWTSRYRTVKSRVAHWHAIGRLSITGRNMLLQSIFYGSMRYWFFSLEVPHEIEAMLESDAKTILWAAAPSLHTDELGTSARSRRYMTEIASYLPQNRGGAGVMHLPSHIKAYQAMWIVQYLSPRDSPWKDALGHWIGDRYELGRGVLLARPSIDFASLLPDSAGYMRACLRSFAQLRLSQDTSLLSYASQEEPLWHNRRYPNPLMRGSTREWSKRLDARRLSSLAAPDDSLFSTAHWTHWIHLIGSRLNQLWISLRSHTRGPMGAGSTQECPKWQRPMCPPPSDT